MTKRLVFFVFLCLIVFGCAKPEEQTRALIINKIAEAQEASKRLNDSSLIYLNNADKLISTIKNPPDSLLIDNNYFRGNYYRQTKDLDSAAYYFHSAINLIDEKNILKKHLGYFRKAWENDLKLEQYSNGKVIANKYIAIQDSNSNTYGVQYAYYFLAQLNDELGNAESEIKNYEKTINASKKAKDTAMHTFANLSLIRLIFDTNRDKAFHFLDSVLLQKNNNQLNRSLYHTYGILKFYNGEYTESIDNYKEAIKFAKKDPSYEYYNYDMTMGYGNIAETYCVINELDNAKKYLDSASLYLNEHSESSEFKFIGKQQLSLSYQKGGSLEETHALIDNMIEIQNKAYEKKIEEEVFALNSANEKQKLLTQQNQETEINNLKLKTRNLILGILIIVIVLIGYILYRQRKFKFERFSLQMQQRLLRSQMNPHFMSNTLYAIQNTIKTDKEGSIQYLTKFSRLLRLILENSMQNYVSLEKELESLKKYLDLQLLRFPEKFIYDININDVEDDIVSVPPMLLQPFVENSIEHGFLDIKHKGKIAIILSYQEKYLSCIIEDNGLGFNKFNGSKKKSASLKLISDFIFKTTKSKISILDRKTINKLDSGTRVEFLMPYKILEND